MDEGTMNAGMMALALTAMCLVAFCFGGMYMKSMKETEAVKAGVGQWIVTDVGEVRFQWKQPK